MNDPRSHRPGMRFGRHEVRAVEDAMSEQTYEAVGDFIQALKYKKTGADRRWDDGEDSKYFRGLVRYWDTELLRDVTARIEFHEEWRPDAARLFAIAADIASPLPTEGRLWEELLFRSSVLEPARYEQTAADRYRKIVLPEPWSHPILAVIAAEMGGMPFLRGLGLESETAYTLSQWRDRFHFAFERAAAAWRGAVVDDLRRPRTDRDPKRFARYAPWAGGRIEAGHSEAERRAEHVTAADVGALLTQMPAELREEMRAKFDRIGRLQPGSAESAHVETEQTVHLRRE